MQSEPGKGSKFVLHLPFKYDQNFDATIPDEIEELKALVFAADNICLMETRTLFDRAGVNTECSLIDNHQGIDPVRECIQRNLPYIDLLVFDQRHLGIDIDAVLDQEIASAVRIIMMGYDQAVEPAGKLQAVEFVSIISTTRLITQLILKDPALSTDDGSDTRQNQGECKSVLLVDDNQVNLKLASELIRLWGHEVTEATHGSEALEIYKNQKFDLIILDIQMPDIDGASLLHLMREHNPQDLTPIVALTANILNDEAGRLIELGFDYYLSKPIDEDKFRSLLNGSPKRRIVGKDSSGTNEIIPDCSVDYTKSLALSADNESLLRQIFEILQRDIPDQQQQLANALQPPDQVKLAAIAHKLNGVTCYASLPRLRRKVLGFQQRLARDSNTPLDEMVQELNAELSAVKQEVDQHLEQMNSAGISG